MTPPAQLPDDSGINDLRLARRLTLLRHYILATLVLLALANVGFVGVLGRNASLSSSDESLNRFVAFSILATAAVIPQAGFLLLAWGWLRKCRGPQPWQQLAYAFRAIRWYVITICLVAMLIWLLAILPFVAPLFV